MGTTAQQEAEVRRLLREDCPFWARKCATIVTKQRRRVRLEAKGEQLRFDQALEEQRAAGKPMRAVILKARQIGFSTWVQAKILQRVTQRRDYAAMVVCQDMETAGKMYEIGAMIWRNLPTEGEWEQFELKPTLANKRRGRALLFGEQSRSQQEMGLDGINSSYVVATAAEFEGGRGGTLTDFHGSECAFWPDLDRKLTGALNAVPDEPETLVVLESTANGYNPFKDHWDDAVDGRNGYAAFFSPWFEDPAYSRAFENDEEREDFLESIGKGMVGEKEPLYMEQFGITAEQLNWRRWKLRQPELKGDLRKWEQEYPATPEEAFISTGRRVFDAFYVSKLVAHAEKADPRRPAEENPGPEVGVLREPRDRKWQRGRHGMVEVPVGAEWAPRAATGFGTNRPFWRVWEQPVEGGAYIVSVDSAEGIVNERGDSDYSAIQVIDHRTRHQVAEYKSREDPDLIAVEAYKAAMFWNRAIIVVERQKGFAIARRIYFDYKWPLHLFYVRKSLGHTKEPEDDLLGWSTDVNTKPLLVDGMKELLRVFCERGEFDIVRSRELADELVTYVQDERGRTGAEKNKHDDLLMANMIAHEVALQMRPREPRAPGRTTSTVPEATRERWAVR